MILFDWEICDADLLIGEFEVEWMWARNKILEKLLCCPTSVWGCITIDSSSVVFVGSLRSPVVR